MSEASARTRTRLYLITPPRVEDLSAFGARFARAAAAGDIAALQIRLKQSSGAAPDLDAMRAAADVARPICTERNIALIINDSLELAEALAADGVHLGQSDGDVADARVRLGPDAIIGATCHASRHLAMEAGEAGADYVAFGAFFPTDTKDPIVRAQPEILTWWQALMELPCVAIGGITAERAPALVEAGADFLAVSAGVWGHPEGPAAAGAAFIAVFDAAAAEPPA